MDMTKAVVSKQKLEQYIETTIALRRKFPDEFVPEITKTIGGMKRTKKTRRHKKSTLKKKILKTRRMSKKKVSAKQSRR